MGRRKVRHYPSREFYENMLNKYFDENREEVISEMMSELGYDSLEKLREDERNMKFGFDCGWIHLVPRNSKMRHEWELDNGLYTAYVWCRPSYCPQSTTIQRIQAKKAVKDLKLDSIFYIDTRLD